MTEVYILRGNYGSLLNYQTSVDLNIIPIIKSITSDQILDEYSDRFEDIGKIKYLQLRIPADEIKAPVAQPHRHIPFYMRTKSRLNWTRTTRYRRKQSMGPHPEYLA